MKNGGKYSDKWTFYIKYFDKINWYGKCSKISNINKERIPKIYFLSSPLKQREVTNFAKGGNLIASLCKIGYFPHRMFGIFLFEIKILLFEFLEHLP